MALMNYPATELRGILKVVNYFEKPMVSQTLPCKEYPGLSENYTLLSSLRKRESIICLILNLS